MAVTIRIEGPLRKFTNNQDKVVMNENGTLRQLIDMLDAQYSGVAERLYIKPGELNRFVNIFVNGEDMRFLSGLQTQIEDGGEVTIISGVAGGADKKNQWNFPISKPNRRKMEESMATYARVVRNELPVPASPDFHLSKEDPPRRIF